PIPAQSGQERQARWKSVPRKWSHPEVEAARRSNDRGRNLARWILLDLHQVRAEIGERAPEGPLVPDQLGLSPPHGNRKDPNAGVIAEGGRPRWLAGSRLPRCGDDGPDR